MALLLDLRHDKDEILRAYLNEIYLGQRGPVAIHGVGAASRHYFAKDVEELSVAESALLAGLIRGPGLYSPHADPIVALERRNFVLSILLEKEKISRETYERSAASPLGVVPLRPDDRPALYFLASLRQELEEAYAARQLETNGYSIFTTLDAQLQRLAQRSVERGLRNLEWAYPELVREDFPLQAALVALEPGSGEVLAMVGGRDFQQSQFNRAIQARRQPGSAFKSVVALAALQHNDHEEATPFTLVTGLEDEPLTVPVPDGEWVPENYAGEFEGRVTLREAIERSLNVPIARLGLELGFERIIETAHRLGIESPLAPVPSLALGASEVTLLELTRAYAVLAAQGRRPEIRSIRAVLDGEGTVLEERQAVSVPEFASEEIYLVTSALRGVVDEGTGRSLRRLGFRGPVAGKTGTTNEYRDGWFIGYTPHLVVGVWVGFDDNQSIGVEGAIAALPIFADFLVASLGPDGESDFERPTGIERVRVNAERGVRAGWGCRGKSEVFLAGTAPTEYCGRRQLNPFATAPFEWLSELFGGRIRVEVDAGAAAGPDLYR
jgi:penicillin-binding protein 1B